MNVVFWYWLTQVILDDNNNNNNNNNRLTAFSSGATRVGRYQKKHSPTLTHPDHWTSFIIFLHLQQ